MSAAEEKARVLIEALPYIRAFSGKRVVIKYGGAAMERADLKDAFALDVVLMRYVGMLPVVVHGGGPQIGQAMERAGLTPRFVNGLRVTDPATMRIVETVLVGEINQGIVTLINRHGGAAVGLSGKDGRLIRARKSAPVTPKGGGAPVDLGLVGEVESVEPNVIAALEGDGFIPVIAPTAGDESGATYNINADVAAGEVAAALQAEKLVVLTDTDGILDRAGHVISSLTRSAIEALIGEGTISKGMLPKVEACLRALEGGVRKAHVINGTIPHALLLEVFTPEGIGTEIVPSPG